MRLEEALKDTQGQNELAWANLERSVITLTGSLVREASTSLRREDVGWSSVSSAAADTSKEYTHAELLKIRKNCREVWRHDGTVCNAERLLLVGSIGKGLIKPTATTPGVQTVVDAVWKDKDNQRVLFGLQALERINLAFMLDGEVFFAVHTSNADSAVKLSLIDPDEITNVIPHPDNKDRPLCYQRTFYDREFDFASGTWVTTTTARTIYYRDIGISDPLDPHAEIDDAAPLLADIPNLQENVAIYHVMVNTVGTRGVPLVARAVEWVKAYHGCIKDLVNLAKALAAIAWYKKVRSRNAEAIAASAQQMSTLPPGAGAVHVANDSTELAPVNVGVGGVSNLSSAMREIYLIVLRCFGFGEHWYCEANTGNLATAQAMELPALWMLTRWQNLYRAIIEELLAFAIERARQRGEVKGEDEDNLSVKVDFPSPEPRDTGSLPNLLNSLDQVSRSGLISPWEASYQAYQALGTSNPTEMLALQFPDGIKTKIEKPVEPVVTKPVVTT
jgi:hypothetical protein